MPVTLSFRGDQVGTISAIDDDGNGSTTITIGETPFLASDTVYITIDDASIDPLTGEFLPGGDVIFLSVQVERNGVLYDLSVDSGSKIKESGGGNNKEQGDSFFTTNDSFGPAASGPFSNIPEDKYAFTTTTTFTAGQATTIPRVTTADFNNDGDTTDPGETGNGNFNVFYADNNPFICFARGSLIRTPGGRRRVEELEVGDLVDTLDDGPQPITWIGSRRIRAPTGSMLPVRFERHAFGYNRPSPDLVVSQQHRVFLGGAIPDMLVGKTEVLAPAKALVNGGSIRIDHSLSEVEYFHIMFERHQIVWSNGILTESFFPGEMARELVDDLALEELITLFPELAAADIHLPEMPLARPVLRAFEARVLAKLVT